MICHFRPSLWDLIHIGISRLLYKYLAEPDIPCSYASPYKFYSYLNETDPGLFHPDGSPKRARVSRFSTTDKAFHRMDPIPNDEKWLRDQLQRLSD